MGTPRAGDRSHGHVQRETGTDSLHVIRSVSFHDGPLEYQLTFNVPLHIYSTLGESERERCRVYCEILFKKMYVVAQMQRIPNALNICLEEALRTYIENMYRGFTRIQIKQGNLKWLVPSTMQRNVLEE